MCCVMGYTGHDLSAAKFKEYLLRTVMRGPDDQRVVEGPFGLMGFGRLAIMGLTPEGMQPFYRGADCVVCNGELYGFRFEKEILKRRGYKFQSDCDCEILLPLYYEYGLDMFRHMDSEFALILYDSRKDRLIAARDPIGIRPLFYGYSKSSHKIAFASEMQNLIGWCDDIRPFPIGSYYCDGRFVRYEDIADVPAPMQDDMDTILTNIREKLIAGVEKRLDADGLLTIVPDSAQPNKPIDNLNIGEIITNKGVRFDHLWLNNGSINVSEGIFNIDKLVVNNVAHFSNKHMKTAVWGAPPQRDDSDSIYWINIAVNNPANNLAEWQQEGIKPYKWMYLHFAEQPNIQYSNGILLYLRNHYYVYNQHYSAVDYMLYQLNENKAEEYDINYAPGVVQYFRYDLYDLDEDNSKSEPEKITVEA